MRSDSTILIRSFGLLYSYLPLFFTGYLNLSNGFTYWGYILASVASTVRRLTLSQAISLYLHSILVLVALTISWAYSFIDQRKRWLSTLPSVAEIPATSIKGRRVSNFRPLGGEMRPTKRGRNTPTIQITPGPIFKEQFVQSPIAEQTAHLFEPLTEARPQDRKFRGRMGAVVEQSSPNQTKYSKPATRGRSVLIVSSVTPAPIRSEAQPENGKTRQSPRSKPRTGRTRYWTLDFNFRSPESRNALLGSLNGLRLLPGAPISSTSVVHVLGVGLSWSHEKEFPLPGATHDIRWLKKFFAHQKQVQFTSLRDDKASFSAIHQKIVHLYETARPSDYLILYFTGHGDGQNAFELYDNSFGSLDEVILNKWIVELRRETSKHIPVYIIFDFCRLSPASSSAQLDNDVTVFWSCPPGQISPDLKQSDDLPYSCFLKAVVLAIYDSAEHHTCPIQSFTLRLTELWNVIWGVRCYRPGPDRRKRFCRHPHSCKQCLAKKSNSYDGGEWPDLQLFGDLNNMHLGKLQGISAAARYAYTRFPLPIRQAYKRLEDNQWFMYFNPSRISTNKGSSTAEIRKFRPDNEFAYCKPGSTRGRSLPLGATSAPTKR